MRPYLLPLLSLSLCSSMVFAQADAPAPVNAPMPPIPAPMPQNPVFDEMQKQREAHMQEMEKQRTALNQLSQQYREKMQAAKTSEEIRAIADEYRQAHYKAMGIEMPEFPYNNAEMNKERADHMAKMKALYDIKDPVERRKQLAAYHAEQRQKFMNQRPLPQQNMPDRMYPPNGNFMPPMQPHFMQQNPNQQQQQMAHEKMMQQHHEQMQQRMDKVEKNMQEMQQNQMNAMPAPMVPPVAPAPQAPVVPQPEAVK